MDPKYRKGRIAPCEQRLLTYLEVLETVSKLEPHLFWTQLGKICKEDYWAFLRFILRLRFLDPWWHGEVIIDFIQETQGEDRIVIVPRDHGKSSTITTPYPCWRVAQDPGLRTQTTNAGEGKARDMVRAQADTITKNDRYRRCFPEIVPGTIWSRDGYFLDAHQALDDDIDGSVERIDPSFKGYGVKGNITGAHVGLQIHDDLISFQTFQSKVEMERVRQFLSEAFRCCETGGEILICCTRWTYHDVYGSIESGELCAHKGPFKVLKRGIFNDKGELVWPQRTYIDLAGKKQKSGYTKVAVESLKKQPLFSALYLGEPLADEDVQFELDLIGRFEIPPFDTGPCRSVGVEIESQAKPFVSTIEMMKRQENRRFRLDVLTSGHVKKETRIQGILGPIIERGQLWMPERVWKSAGDLGEELRTFPVGSDDLLDAAAYCAKNAPKHTPGRPPTPYVACDPAWSDAGKWVDASGIVCGCWFEEDFYILATKKIQTSRPEILVRMIFRMYDQFSRNRNSQAFANSYSMPMKGYRSSGVRGGNKAEGLSFRFNNNLKRRHLNEDGQDEVFPKTKREEEHGQSE